MVFTLGSPKEISINHEIMTYVFGNGIPLEEPGVDYKTLGQYTLTLSLSQAARHILNLDFSKSYS